MSKIKFCFVRIKENVETLRSEGTVKDVFCLPFPMKLEVEEKPSKYTNSP